MIPPHVLQGIVMSICKQNGADGVLLIIYRERSGLETIAAANGKKCINMAALLRDVSSHIEEGREIDQIPSANGIHKPDDVFRINARCNRPGWVNVLVTAREIHHWGIQAIASAPTALDCCAQFPVRLSWDEIDFIGRPKAMEEEKQPTVTTKEAKDGL
jgi:hypothetical protein